MRFERGLIQDEDPPSSDFGAASEDEFALAAALNMVSFPTGKTIAVARADTGENPTAVASI